jgi:hypothetical protein
MEGKEIGRFQPKNLETLKQIVRRDYGFALSDDEAESFGLSLLRITRLAKGAFNRVEDNRSLSCNQLQT